MRAYLYRWLLPIGLATASLVGTLETASAEPAVRDHRGPRPPRNRGDGADAGPREAPPPIREERVRPKGRGWVWVQGHWDWRGGRWEWTGGRWEKLRQGRRWRPISWELRNGVYVRVDGDWIDDRPNQAPPSPREERFEGRRGFTWVPGYWDWQNGEYVWVDGRYERERRGKRWRQARWELRDGAWVRIDGTWDDDVVSQYPNEAPPPPREERPGSKAGFTWVRGKYEWRDGRYVWVDGHWERERANQRWIEGRWELRNGRWEWVEGSWQSGGGAPPPPTTAYPTQPPPALRDERPGTKGGFLWIRGHWDWRNGQYVWVDGHWERERARERWVDGRWELRNGRWEWVAGSWQSGGAAPEPALDTRGWTLLREHLFDEKNEYRQFDVSQKQGRFSRVMLQVLDNDVELREVYVVYVDGEKFAPPIRRSFRNGSGTAAIDLAPNKILRAVTMYVKTPGRARVLLWGSGSAPPPTTTNPPPPPSGPSQPPPPPREESPGTKGGFLWIRGHYEWRGNQYEWIPGHWERERARQRWIDGRWELRGGVYVWSPGYWQ